MINKIPYEILDIIFYYTNDYKMVLPFRKYISLITIKHLLKDIDVNICIKNENILIIHNILLFKKIDMYGHYHLVSEKIIEEFHEKIDFNFKLLNKYNKLSENFINKFINEK